MQENQIKVNILPNPNFKKPDKKEIGKIQKLICKDENIQVLDFKQFAHLVGNKGYIWKSSLLEGGSKNENFKEAYILSLDFDDGVTINDFLENSRSFGLEPTFIYKTFSHTKENHRFRAIWKLNEVITLPQLKTALQLMLMEVFPQCDSACKDLSRLWIGGKEVSFYKFDNTLNLDNLLNALVTVISEKGVHNLTRNIKSFCKKIGINIYNKYPFMLKSEENHENPYKVSYRELRKNPQKIDIFLYDNMEFSFDTDSYKIDKNVNRSAKIQTIKGEKIKKTKIDYDKLKDKCNLFNDFINGNKLDHKEIMHLSCNLYEFEKYPTVLENTLKKHSYNNWENKYNTYASALNYGYSPTRCERNCKYYNECMNPLNIKEKYYQKETRVKKIYDLPTITLKEAETKLLSVMSNLKDIDKDTFTFIKAPTGIGKSTLLQKIDLKNTIIGVSNHRLGQQLYNELVEGNPNNKGLLYVKPINTENMPGELKYKIQRFYDLGVPGEVKSLAFEEIKRLNKLACKGVDFPKYYFDLIQYVEQLEAIPEADSLLFTHYRVSFGTSNNKIDTIILDEDFLKSFIKYNFFTKETIFNDLMSIRTWAKKFDYENSKYYEDYLELLEITENFNIEVEKHRNDCKWFENPLKEIMLNPKFNKFIIGYIKENLNNLNMDIFKVFRSEYISIKQNTFIHFVNGEAIKELEKYKIIVLSATLDEEIHINFINKYLPNKEINWIEISNTELKGQIYSDCSYSFSREGLKNITNKSKLKLEKILNSDKYDNVISFMNDELIDIESYNKNKITHFGATEGINGYDGQNLCIIGTPHNNSALYEAYGVLLTGESPISNTWKVKRVRKYGFEFDLNTYENDEDNLFTKIQLYFLYSELIQAVGRARALRNECKVYVNSALPMPNSELI